MIAAGPDFGAGLEKSGDAGVARHTAESARDSAMTSAWARLPPPHGSFGARHRRREGLHYNQEVVGKRWVLNGCGRESHSSLCKRSKGC